MNWALIAAVVALLRADATHLVGGQSLNAILGGRFYNEEDVPSGADFPRCYIGLDGRSKVTRWSTETDRHAMFHLLFATTKALTPTGEQQIQAWDAAAAAILDMNVATAGLVYFRREGEISNPTQHDDLTSYLVGGSLWHAYFQD